MRILHSVFYTSAFWLAVFVYALFHGVQVTLPIDGADQQQAEVERAKSILARDIFDVADVAPVKPVKSSKHK